jgi:ABC-2 type transport system permease protein
VTAALARIAGLMWRSFAGSMREPGLVVPAFVVPPFLLAFSASQLQPLTTLPGFPTDNMVAFAVPIALINGTIFPAISSGIALARDLNSGFFSRLSLTPARRLELLVSVIAGPAFAGVLAQIGTVALGALAGAGLPRDVVSLLLLLVVLDIAFSAFGVAVALWTESAEAVGATLPLMMAALGLSTVNVPRDYIAVDWFHAVATANPASLIVESFRWLYGSGIEHWSLLSALATAGGGVTAAGAAAIVAMWRRF